MLAENPTKIYLRTNCPNLFLTRKALYQSPRYNVTHHSSNFLKAFSEIMPRNIRYSVPTITFTRDKCVRSSSQNAWIGLSDSGYEGMFVWEGDQSGVSYTHWVPGAPDNFGGVEDCVEVLSGALAGFWNDDYCDSEKHYICEMPDGMRIEKLPVIERNAAYFAIKRAL